jgi:hypothetical protein
MNSLLLIINAIHQIHICIHIHFAGVLIFLGINMKTKMQQDRCHQHFDYHKDKWIQDK